MSFITLENLTKEYTRFNKEEGLKEASKPVQTRIHLQKGGLRL